MGFPDGMDLNVDYVHIGRWAQYGPVSSLAHDGKEQAQILSL